MMIRVVYFKMKACNYLIENYQGLKETNTRMITTGRPSEIMKEVSFSVKANVGTKSQGWSEGG